MVLQNLLMGYEPLPLMENFVQAVLLDHMELSRAIWEINHLLEKEAIEQRLSDQEMIALYQQEEMLEKQLPPGQRKTEYMKSHGYRMREIQGMKLWVK